PVCLVEQGLHEPEEVGVALIKTGVAETFASPLREFADAEFGEGGELFGGGLPEAFRVVPIVGDDGAQHASRQNDKDRQQGKPARRGGGRLGGGHGEVVCFCSKAGGE